MLTPGRLVDINMERVGKRHAEDDEVGIARRWLGSWVHVTTTQDMIMAD